MGGDEGEALKPQNLVQPVPATSGLSMVAWYLLYRLSDVCGLIASSQGWAKAVRGSGARAGHSADGTAVVVCLTPGHQGDLAAQDPAVRDTKRSWFVLKRPLHRNGRFNVSQAISCSISLH